MPQAQDPAAYIYEGFWTNWSKGNAVAGLTLTLAPSRATLVTNTLALFFALAGGQLWTILRFIIHQYRASASVEENLFHKEQQVILRNATTDLSTSYLLWVQASGSRRTAKSLKPAIYISILAVFHSALFLLGGTFSNQLASAGPLVLSRSPFCGVWNMTYYEEALQNGAEPSGPERADLSFHARTALLTDLQRSTEYAQSCYLNQSLETSSSSGPALFHGQSQLCQTLRKPSLTWTTSTNASCHFSQELCHGNSPTIILETPALDLQDDLGVNSAPQDRLTYRKRVTCAVLNDTAHLSGWDGVMDTPSDYPEHKVASIYYGPNLIRPGNDTYTYSNYASFYTNYSVGENTFYHLLSLIAYDPSGPSAANSDFLAMPAFNQQSEDLMLTFLSFIGNYLTPIDDPLFSAHRVRHIDDATFTYMDTQYGRDQPFNTLACAEKHQVCNPSRKICTPYAGLDAIQADAQFNSSLTPHQNATFDRLTWALGYTNTYWIIYALSQAGGRLLQAADVAAGSTHVLSLGLPDNQWQMEVNYWQSIAMAHLQRQMSGWATGQIAADTSHLLPPTMEQDKWFCRNFTVPSTAFQSFSVVMLLAIFVLGLLIIVVSLTIEHIASYLRRKTGRGAARWQYWVRDNMMNLPLLATASDLKPDPPPKQTKPGSLVSMKRSFSSFSTETSPPPDYRTSQATRPGVWVHKQPSSVQPPWI